MINEESLIKKNPLSESRKKITHCNCTSEAMQAATESKFPLGAAYKRQYIERNEPLPYLIAVVKRE